MLQAKGYLSNQVWKQDGNVNEHICQRLHTRAYISRTLLLFSMWSLGQRFATQADGTQSRLQM